MTNCVRLGPRVGSALRITTITIAARHLYFYLLVEDIIVNKKDNVTG